jgi:hypothetical protein
MRTHLDRVLVVVEVTLKQVNKTIVDLLKEETSRITQKITHTFAFSLS